MRILIANPFGIGDLLFSLPLVNALRDSYPDGFLGFLCNRRTEELVGSWPMLDWTVVFEKDEFRAAWRRSKREGLRRMAGIIQAVRRQRFDLMLDLSLGWQIGLAASLAGIPRRVGFDFRGRGRFLTDRLPIDGFHDQPVPGYYLDLLQFLGLPRPSDPRLEISLSPEVIQGTEEWLRSLQIPRGSRLIGMVPGGGASWGPYAPFKQWPPQRFAEVADRLSERHGAAVLLIGDSKEVPLRREVARLAKSEPAPVVAQAPSLLLLAGILKRCELVVGNDSGPMHLAAAVGTKTVSIFGPVDGSVYGPFPAKPIQRVVAKGLACRPCYRGFRFPPCPWDNACLKRLETGEVLEAVEELLR
ncbi:MAG: glycosyltransferase family 9 protein [Candidatus Omnitrophica bacterium]|nr:glycosyltransferase family 9 protein [Candidatus Omnitrophota bacterium]